MCLSQQSPHQNGGIIKQMGSVRGRFHDRYSTEYLSCNWPRIGLIVGIKSVLVRAARLHCQAGINHCLGQCWPSFYVTISVYGINVLSVMLPTTSSLCSLWSCHVFFQMVVIVCFVLFSVFLLVIFCH